MKCFTNERNLEFDEMLFSFIRRSRRQRARARERNLELFVCCLFSSDTWRSYAKNTWVISPSSLLQSNYSSHIRSQLKDLLHNRPLIWLNRNEILHNIINYCVPEGKYINARAHRTERHDRLLPYPDSFDFRLKYSLILTYASSRMRIVSIEYSLSFSSSMTRYFFEEDFPL